MLEEEASWLRRELERLGPESIYPMCNLGSSTLKFRTVDQPYIDAELFARPRDLGYEVVHVDMKTAPGVDVVADIFEPDVSLRLQQKNFKSVMCCNLLEHVVDRRKFADVVMSIVKPGGYIVVTVPNEFPYHEDPIDTMFRPSIADVATLFPGAEVARAEIIRASRFKYDMKGSWRQMFWLAVRVCVPIYRPKRWAASVRYLSALSRRYRVTCMILRRSQSTET
jgi:hypothetical protein